MVVRREKEFLSQPFHASIRPMPRAVAAAAAVLSPRSRDERIVKPRRPHVRRHQPVPAPRTWIAITALARDWLWRRSLPAATGLARWRLRASPPIIGRRGLSRRVGMSGVRLLIAVLLAVAGAH